MGEYIGQGGLDWEYRGPKRVGYETLKLKGKLNNLNKLDYQERGNIVSKILL